MTRSKVVKLTLLEPTVRPTSIHVPYHAMEELSHNEKRILRRCDDEAVRLENRQGLTHIGAILDVEHCARDCNLAVAIGK